MESSYIRTVRGFGDNWAYRRTLESVSGVSVRRTREDFSSSRLWESCSLFSFIFLFFSISVFLSFWIYDKLSARGTRAFYLRDEFASVPPVSPSALFVPSDHGFSVLPAAPRRARSHYKTQAHNQLCTHVRVSRLCSCATWS